MNLKELEYIVKIADEHSLTRAAERLGITSSALNQQLLRLERELGLPLFFRARSGWQPTLAGEVYLDTAREMLQMKQITYHRLQDIADPDRGSLSIGLDPERGGALLAAVGPAFRRESPQITLRIQELDTRSQQQAIAQGTLDLGFVALAQSQRTDDHYLPIRQEELMLALPAGHPACAFARPEEGQHPVLDLSLLRRAVFALPQPGSCLREYVDRLFQQAGYTPQILLESAGAASALALTAAGLCVSLVPGGLCCPPPEGVQLFCMPGHPQWALEAVTRKDAYLSKAARRFLQMAKEHFA